MTLLVLSSCGQERRSYLVNPLTDHRDEQIVLLQLLESKTNDPETRFALMNQIATNLLSEGQTDIVRLFLTSAVEDNPDDPYNAFWLLMVAHVYLQDNAPRMAEYYFERILNNFTDLSVKGDSIHRICLQNLIKITENPELQVFYYSQLITRFAEEIDLGHSYFMLARSYERLGEWDLAIQTYVQFLSYGKYDIQIPGIADAYDYAKRLVDYNSSSKDWTFENLDELVASVKAAISEYNFRNLDSYRAKVNFFAMSWKQDAKDNNAQADFQMRDFMGGNRIRFSSQLDAASTPNEAYLRTEGWSQYISIWYLYFRKVNFPADPDIHGRWEWAGIYYGEKL